MSEFDVREDKPSRRRWRRSRRFDAAALVVVVGALVAIGTIGAPKKASSVHPSTTTSSASTTSEAPITTEESSTTTSSTTRTPPTLGPLLGGRTGTVLVFGPGSCAVNTLDLDTGAFKSIPASSNGCQIAALRHGFLLVTSTSTSAPITVLSADAAAVRTLDVQNQYGYVFTAGDDLWASQSNDASQTVWREFDSSGKYLQRAVTLPLGANPSGATPTKLVVYQSGSITAVDGATGAITDLGHGDVLAVAQDHVAAWTCQSLKCHLDIRSTDDGSAATIDGIPSSYEFSANFSPDGRRLALVVQHGPQGQLWLIDVATRTARVIAEMDRPTLAFAPGGDYLFAVDKGDVRAFNIGQRSWTTLFALDVVLSQNIGGPVQLAATSR